MTDCWCRKSLVDDVVTTCEEILDTQKIAKIILFPSNGLMYWLIAVVEQLRVYCY